VNPASNPRGRHVDHPDNGEHAYICQAQGCDFVYVSDVKAQLDRAAADHRSAHRRALRSTGETQMTIYDALDDVTNHGSTS
jgi:hypothetical protein